MEWYFGNEVEEDVVVPKTYGQISSSSPEWGLVNSSFPKKNQTSQSTITQETLSGFWNNEADYQHFAEEEARINHMNDIFFGSLLEDYPTYKDSTRPHDNTILGNNVFEDDMLNSQWGNGEVSTMPKQQYTSNENMEESVLNDLERVTAQFTDRTRICFRDAFYRLAAESSKQSCRDEEPVITCIDDTLRTEGGGGGESKTNVIDRAVASLMFHKNEYYEDAQAQPTVINFAAI